MENMTCYNHGITFKVSGLITHKEGDITALLVRELDGELLICYGWTCDNNCKCEWRCADYFANDYAYVALERFREVVREIAISVL